ncbi:hypothetical protein HWV62_11572 [Athelia sp. TMB]|nr:hypothetical protein HWV62_11572 [Athelia sp. TMB]
MTAALQINLVFNGKATAVDSDAANPPTPIALPPSGCSIQQMSASIPTSLPPISFLFQALFERYIFLATFVAYVYDWLLCVPEEVAIIEKRGLSWQFAIYLLSRVSECSHVTLIAVLALAPVPDCELIFVIIGAFSVFSVASTSYLFLLRVKAVYMQSKSITIFFTTLWLVNIAMVILANTKLSIEHVPYAPAYCTNVGATYFSLPSISSFINDTSVFLAISYRLASEAATERTWRSWVQSVVRGKDLYNISRALLQSGQMYYLCASAVLSRFEPSDLISVRSATILFFFLNLVIMESPRLGSVTRYSLVNMYIAFTNIMACRVFRGIALGVMEDNLNPTSWNTARIAAALESHAPHRMHGGLIARGELMEPRRHLSA